MQNCGDCRVPPPPREIYDLHLEIARYGNLGYAMRKRGGNADAELGDVTHHTVIHTRGQLANMRRPCGPAHGHHIPLPARLGTLRSCGNHAETGRLIKIN